MNKDEIVIAPIGKMYYNRDCAMVKVDPKLLPQYPFGALVIKASSL